MTAPRVIKSLPTSSNGTRQVIRVGYAEEAPFVAEGDHMPEVECVTEDCVVTRIQVKCSCGKLTTLICQYAEKSA